MSGQSRKVAFVTGASSGIGRETAGAFIRQGYALALVDRDRASGEAFASELRRSGHDALFISCDVSDEVAVCSAVELTVATFGGLDAAFNAAGIDGEEGRLTAQCSSENWHRVIAVNLTGLWHCMRHQIPAMLAGGGGAIVNCASVAGLVGAPTYAAYSAAKHGVIGLTKSAALEYARANVRINAVCPGMIDTAMTRGGKEKLFDVLVAESPTGRRGLPEEIAEAVLWLCADAASFVVGQALAVDGGWTSR